MLELALVPKLALTEVAPVQTGTLEPYLVHLPAVLLAVGGEFLEPRLAVGSLFLQSFECLLGFAGGAFLLRDAVLAARLLELCPVVGLDLVPVRLRVRRAVLHDDVDDVEEVPFVVEELDGVGVRARVLRCPGVLADDVSDGGVIASLEEVGACVVGIVLQHAVEPIEQGLLLRSLAARLLLGGGGGGASLLRCALLSGIGLRRLLVLLILFLLLGFLLGLVGGAHVARRVSALALPRRRSVRDGAD